MRAAHRKGGRAMPRSVTMAVIRSQGVDVEGRIVYFDVTGRHAPGMMGLGHLGRIALLDRDEGQSGQSPHRSSTSARAHRTGCRNGGPARRRPTCRSCWPRRRSLRYGRSRPARPAPGPRSSRREAMLSQISVTSIPASSARRTSAGLLAAEDASHRHRPRKS